MPASKAVKMTQTKKTKGAVMFVADDETMPITNIYFRKDSLAKLGMEENTQSIEVTVTVK